MPVGFFPWYEDCHRFLFQTSYLQANGMYRWVPINLFQPIHYSIVNIRGHYFQLINFQDLLEKTILLIDMSIWILNIILEHLLPLEEKKDG